MKKFAATRITFYLHKILICETFFALKYIYFWNKINFLASTCLVDTIVLFVIRIF